IEPLVLDRMHGHARGFRALDQLARTTVVTRSDHIDGAHAFRMLAQSRGDRVKAGEIAGVGHRSRFAVLSDRLRPWPRAASFGIINSLPQDPARSRKRSSPA